MSCRNRSVPGGCHSAAPDGHVLDVRGPDYPDPVAEVLRVIDSGDEVALLVEMDQESLLLYPELDDRGWTYELLGTECSGSSCSDGIRLRLTRLRP